MNVAQAAPIMPYFGMSRKLRPRLTTAATLTLAVRSSVFFENSAPMLNMKPMPSNTSANETIGITPAAA